MRQLVIAALLAASLAAPTVRAETYPAHPIIMVIPLSPGGSTDVIGRIMAAGMGAAMGATIVVENTTGAGGTIGEARISRAKPDGYTIGIGQWGTNMANGAIYPLQYDLAKDFTPIGLIATQPEMIVAKKSMPANTLKELIEYVKTHKVTMGNSGIGSPSHVSGIFLQKAIGAEFTMVPYRGAGESTQAIIGGQIDILLNSPLATVPQMKSGLVKVYAVSAPTRVAIAPDVPTTDEAGLPGHYFSFWHALWAPKNTPKEIIAVLNTALRKALVDPATRKKLIDSAQDIFPEDQQSPEALAKFQQAEMDKWWPIIKEAGIKVQ